MKKFTILAGTFVASMISAQAALVYTQGYDAIDVSSRDSHELQGASPTVNIGQVFGPVLNNGVNVTGGTLNFTGNTFSRGAGVWVDSSAWVTGDVTVTFDISNFVAATGGASALYVYTADGLSATTGVGIDVHSGTTVPETTGPITDVGSLAITADGSLSYTFANVAGTDVTAFVFFGNDNVWSVDDLSVDNCPPVVPEPSSALLLGLGGLALGARRRK